MPDGAGGAPTGRIPSFLAFDFGTRRTGVASGNRLVGHATALTTRPRWSTR